MALPSSGNITLGMVRAEFGGSASNSLRDYYRGGSFVPSTSANSSVPTSGVIKLTDFRGASNAPYATGGTVTTSSGWRIHTFTGSGTLNVIHGGTMEYLIIAGGGGGAVRHSGGGGAGGYRTGTQTVTSGSKSVTVGAGGTGPVDGSSGTRLNVTAGTNSSVTGIVTSTGGGTATSVTNNPITGGSAGGQAAQSGQVGGFIAGQGHAGGSGSDTGFAGGGGGGAGGAGGNAASNGSTAGVGGSGASSSITGSSVVRASGGRGSKWEDETVPINGPANSGDGGGAGGGPSNGGGSGGSGIVIVRYQYP